MSGPEVVVAFDAEGAAKVKQELGATDKQLEKVNKQLQRLTERAQLQEMKNQSEAFRAATDRLAKAQGRYTKELGKTQKAFAKMGSFANKANEIGQFAGSVLGTAQALFEFAQAGSEAAAVAATFDQLGDAAASMNTLREATAGVVDDTTLQGYAKLASDLGLTSEEMAGLAQRATTLAADTGQLADTSEIMTRLLNGEAEGLRNLGVAIDLSAEEFKGLTEAQKKLAIAQKLAAEGSQEQVDALEGSQVAMAQSSTKIDNLVSDAQVMFVEFLEGSGIMDTLSSVLDTVAELLRSLSPVLGLVASGFDLAMSATAPFRGLLDLLVITVDQAVYAVKRIARFLGMEGGVGLTATTRMAEEALADLKVKHEKAAAAALEQAKAVGVLNSALGQEREFAALTTHQIDRLVSLSEAGANGVSILADSMMAAGGSFEGATRKLGELDEQLGEAMDTEAIVGENTRQVSDLIFAVSQEIERRKRAQDKGTNSTRKAIEADTEYIDTIQTMIAQVGVLTDSILVEAASEASAMSARIALQRLYTEGRQELVDTLWRSFEVGEALAEQTLLDIENLRRRNELIAEGKAELDANIASLDAFGSAVIHAGNAMGKAGDKVSALVGITGDLGKALKESSGASQQFGASIAAGKAVTAAVVDDTTTQAAILGAFEVAEAAANFANPFAAAAHGAAAALYFGVAAKGGKGGGGGGGGGASGDAATAAPAVADIAEEPTLPGRGSGQTVVFNVESINPEAAGDSVLTAINSFTQAGGGNLIDPSAIGEQQGRSGF